MINLDEIIDISPYSMEQDEKHKFLSDYLNQLTNFHYENCREYKNILDGIGYDDSKVKSYYDLPFLPVRLFKKYSLTSVSDDAVAKTMTSSGTTGQSVSKIYLDKATSMMQTKVLTKIVNDYVGNKRMPMIILDSSSVMKDRAMFSARGAGIRGFSFFGRQPIYALDENMDLDLERLKVFCEEHRDEKVLLFGFTFMIWQHFCKRLEETGAYLDLSNAILIHGGGWKKLAQLNISTEQFKRTLKRLCGIKEIHDYYGMVEQTGSIYMECECGHLHASNFSDVIIRRYKDFSVADIGERGIVQVVSVLPHSYPGHSLLTEDEGEIIGEDDCLCGRKGKYIKIYGRIKNAELRGCSDTYAAGYRTT